MAAQREVYVNKTKKTRRQGVIAKETYVEWVESGCWVGLHASTFTTRTANAFPQQLIRNSVCLTESWLINLSTRRFGMYPVSSVTPCMQAEQCILNLQRLTSHWNQQPSFITLGEQTWFSVSGPGREREAGLHGRTCPAHINFTRALTFSKVLFSFICRSISSEQRLNKLSVT